MPPAATAEKSETALQTPEAADIFVSRREDLRLVKKPARDRRDAEGNAVERIPGQVVRFREGRLIVPRSGDFKFEDGTKGKLSEVREFLESHPMFGDVEEGFWPLPMVAPTASANELQELVRLAQEGDADGLRAFIASEEAGYAREDMLAVAHASLRRLETGGETKE